MTDETDEEIAEVDVVDEIDDDSRSEFLSWQAPSGKGGEYIFPLGITPWAVANGVQVMHIDTASGAITAQYEHGQPFRAIDKPAGHGSVKSIK
jgi:hypothetical protein